MKPRALAVEEGGGKTSVGCFRDFAKHILAGTTVRKGPGTSILSLPSQGRKAACHPAASQSQKTAEAASRLYTAQQLALAGEQSLESRAS